MTPSAARASSREAQGFTLVELMVAVLIIGVLAVAATAGYHRFIVSSRMAEATNVLSGIKQRQEGYRAETGVYLNVSKFLGANQGTGFSALYPHCLSGIAAPSKMKVAWGGAACPASCCNSGTDWTKLQVETSGPVVYGYSTVSGVSTTPTATVTMNGTAIAWPPTVVGPWFAATAVGDADGNAIYSTVLISSFDNEVHIDNDGE